jgi:hypothetical protein
MRRTPFALTALATCILITAGPRHAVAGSPVTGTVSCTALGFMAFGSPYLPTMNAEPLIRPLPFKTTNDSSTCDGSAVAGGKAEISTVDVRLSGKLGADTSCASFLDTVSITGKVKLRWRGVQPRFGFSARNVTVGTSKATIASATYDGGTDSLVLVTNPIKGAFTNSTVTMHILMGGATYADLCANNAFRLTGFRFGVDNPLQIDVQ